MNNRIPLIAPSTLIAVLCITLLPGVASAQAPLVDSLSRNGRLLATNLAPGTLATVEWAPTIYGPWTNNYAGLDAVRVDANGSIRVNVPMFYRVKGVPGTNVVADMVFIPGGPFAMGDSFNEGRSDEQPVHTVFVSSFYMGRHEVTQAQWDDVYQWGITHGYNWEYNASGKAGNYPAAALTWFDAAKWCNARSEKEGKTPAYYTSTNLTTVYRTGSVQVVNSMVKWNGGYRLPTEAEWEKAARGGLIGQRFPLANSITHVQANYYSTNSYSYDISSTRGIISSLFDGTSATSLVGSFEPNAYGVYDMAGNVMEWVWDWYLSDYYGASPSVDPRGPDSYTGYRVIRGGSWFRDASWMRLAARAPAVFSGGFNDKGLGFRVVLAP